MTAGGGLFVAFEGIDGSGKSTQARRLAASLRDACRDVVLTREPGGSPGAEQIRALLVEGEPGRWSAETEILLFTAARRDHVERTIRPALEAGRIVVCDRFADSTRVYQGATRGDRRALVDELHARMIGLEPDLTFVVDLAPEAAAARGRAFAEQRFETFGCSFQTKARDGFLGLAENSARHHVLDGTRSAAELGAEILRRVEARLA